MSELFTAQELKKRMLENDNRSTAQPYLLLLQEKETYIANDEYAYNYEDRWVEEYSGDYVVEGSREALIERFKGNYGEDYEEIKEEFEQRIKPFKQGYHWKTVNVFLTDKGYEDHKKINGHNLIEHRTYGVHAFRNKEIKSLLALIDQSIALQKENEELKETCRMISNELIYLSPEIAEKYGETIDRLLGGGK